MVRSNNSKIKGYFSLLLMKCGSKHCFSISVPIFVVCTFNTPPDAKKIRHEGDNLTSNDTKETKPEEVLEILMDVPSSIHFSDIVTNIVNQLGISDDLEERTKGI